jgi:exopolyphosphatase / guanosine-5'-triphosphate,3'-diphosphate pyrophosphatase
LSLSQGISYIHDMGTKRLVIDIGTNSVLALLADVDGDKLTIISDRKKTTRLGEGLSTNGYLSQSAMLRTADAVTEFVKDSQVDELLLVGTEALRLARNSDDFSNMLADSLGQKPTIVTGLKEAELTFYGALYNLNVNSEYFLFIDVGGGSTELVAAGGDGIIDSISIPIGALKLKEIVSEYYLESFKTEALRAVKKGIADFRLFPAFSIIGTGGTITSAAAIKDGILRYNAETVHGSILSTADMQAIALKFQEADSAARVGLIPFDPERADLILPGLGIFLAVMGIIDRRSLTVSTGGVRFGAALRPDKLLP